MLIITLWIIWTFLNFNVTRGYDDLSANKLAQQYKTASACLSCVASKAVDRDIQTCARMEDIGTTSTDKRTWWYVDLGDIYSLYNIRIQYKDVESFTMRQRGRFAGFSLYVSNTTDQHSWHLCYKDGPELPLLDFNTNCITHGRYVIFYNERLPGATYPMSYELPSVFTELCEVTVTGCSSSGVFGVNCDKPCPENCQERRCNMINGACLGCTLGWLGAQCDKACPVGYYGLQCESKCVGHCKDGAGCNHTSGLCDDGCDDGWTGSNCIKECPLGSYGPDCVFNCSKACLGDVACNRTTGKCDTGCNVGYTGDLCETECPMRTVGPECVHKCSGKCLGDVECNRTTGKCNTGCDSGYTRELRETDCEMGTFGKGCSYRCSGHCLDNVPCNPTTGHCDSGCASGYVEPFCKKSCEMGTYGKGCSNKCSGHCLENVPCNSTTGHCDSGCASGYVQPFCNTTCDDSKYGQKFMQNCSLKCINELCNNVDGSCICRIGNRADLKITAFGEGCDDPSYIPALSVIVFLSVVLGSVCILFMWKYYRLVKKVRSLQYTSIIRTLAQDNNANNCQQYEELRISDSRYHNIELRN